MNLTDSRLAERLINAAQSEPRLIKSVRQGDGKCDRKDNGKQWLLTLKL